MYNTTSVYGHPSYKVSSLSRFHTPNDCRDNKYQRGEKLILKTGFSCALCWFCFRRSSQQSDVVDSVWVGWHQFFLYSFSQYILNFLCSVFHWAMKPANNVGGLYYCGSNLARLKIQAFSLQLLDCCSLVRLMALFYCQPEGKMKLISLQNVSHSFTEKEKPYKSAPQRLAL